MLPYPSKIGAHSPQNIKNLIPALLLMRVFNSPYTKGEGKYPKAFLMIYPVELPKALRYGETEIIIIPVSPGIIAPPKNNTIQSKMVMK